jgi:hypothetical protein
MTTNFDKPPANVLQRFINVLQWRAAMKSVRLDVELEGKLERAARVVAMSQSEFLRDALARRCDEVLGASLQERLAAVVGILHTSGGQADRTGAAFRDALDKRRKR